MSMKKGLALMLAGAVAVMAGCGGAKDGGTNPGTTTPTNPTTPPAPTAPKEKVTIEFWHGMSPESAHGKTLGELVTAYNASQQEVEVKPSYHGSYTDLEKKITTAIAGKTPPAVVQATDSMLTKLVKEEAIADITAKVAGERADYTETMLKALTFGDKLMALPFNKSAIVLVYDKAAVPNPPKNWEEFEAAAKAATDTGKGRYGTAFNADVYYFGTHFAGAGGKWLSDDMKSATFNSDAGVKALDLIGRMAKDKSALQLQPNEYQSNFFNEGRAAMIATTSASFAFIKPIKPEIQWDVAPLYAGPAADAVPLSGANVALIDGIDEKQAEAGMKFMMWLTGKEGTLKWATAKTGYMPVRKSAVESDEWKTFVAANPHYKILGDSLAKGVVQPNHEQWGAIQKEITAAVQKVSLGQATSKEALDAAATKASGMLK